MSFNVFNTFELEASSLVNNINVSLLFQCTIIYNQHLIKIIFGFSCQVLWSINLRGLFNAKVIHVENSRGTV